MKKSQTTLLAAFANTPTYGGGMKIAPRAQMDDGLLDVCMIGAVDPFKLACMFPTVYFGRHLNIREVDYFSAAHLRVETDHPLDLYADGEYVCRTPAEITVQPAALRVIVHSSMRSFWKFTRPSTLRAAPQISCNSQLPVGPRSGHKRGQTAKGNRQQYVQFRTSVVVFEHLCAGS